jgi:hypothetical protein
MPNHMEQTPLKKGKSIRNSNIYSPNKYDMKMNFNENTQFIHASKICPLNKFTWSSSLNSTKSTFTDISNIQTNGVCGTTHTKSENVSSAFAQTNDYDFLETTK